MLDYMNIYVNDADDNSFYVRLLLHKDEGSYLVESGYGRHGLFVTWCAPETGLKSNIFQGKITDADFLSARIEGLISALIKKRKTYSSEYEQSKQIMGTSTYSFGLDYRLEGRVNTHHITGLVGKMPTQILDVLRIMVDIGIIDRDRIQELGEE